MRSRRLSGRRAAQVSYLALLAASTVLGLAPAAADDPVERTLDFTNLVEKPVDSGPRTFIFHLERENSDLTLTGTNYAAIAVPSGSLITLGASNGDSEKVFFKSIDYRNLGAISTSAKLDDFAPAVSLGSFGLKGEDGHHHPTRSGGAGDPGGTGGSITFTNSALITVRADPSPSDQDKVFGWALLFSDASGVYGQSNGGAGGSGGHAGSFGHGGHGGRGGDGGDVTITNEAGGIISTASFMGHGIKALSLGGIGGDAGGGSGFAAGNDGGLGGNGGTVSITNQGAISTGGSASPGAVAISQGGGGGDGSGGGLLRRHGSGDGGDGNAGGSASVTNSGKILTAGMASPGVYVASVGGNGGAGASEKGLFVAVGATGGHGGNGAGATFTQTAGSIVTSGDLSPGVHVQSIGGGGGRGGDAGSIGLEGSVAIGGAGGGGGDAGAVTIKLSGTIATTGRDAAGIMAQSIGGGGGAAGDASAKSAGVGVSASVAIGGRGGEGGNGGNVSVTTYASSAITTGTAAMITVQVPPDTADADKPPAVLSVKGEHGYGILAQSVGGGGGHGGRAASYAFAGGGDSPAGSIAFSMGGSGSVAGHGDVVAVTNAATITTYAGRADGIVAQSIGGGGGSGGNTISVSGAASPAGALAAGVGLGGKGGGGGDGGNVTVTNAGTITTLSSQAAGIVAQSIGGGGGNGGSVLSVEASLGKNSINGSVDIGGQAGKGGHGSSISVTHTGSIVTFGHQSYGLIAQSVGGGGGNGGSVHDYSVSIASGKGDAGGKSVNLGVDLGGTGGSGGFGGVAAVTQSGSIFTGGDLAHGVVVQSIGGGGGTGGGVTTVSVSAAISKSADSEGTNPGGTALSARVSIGGKGGDGGVGGLATYTSNAGASIRTEGAMSDGILVQSVGGGGGAGGHANSLAVTTIVPTSGKDVLASLKGSMLGKLLSGGAAKPADGTSTDPAGSTSGEAASAENGAPAGPADDAPAGDTPADKPADKPRTGIQGTAVSLTADVGGNGGVGAKGGTVTVTLDPATTIVTLGSHSHGVFAQSVGGGGGRGGAANTDSISLVSTYTGSATIGGSGGWGNDGGSVTVSDAAGAATGIGIVTGGANSHGIFAQSLGGGGGDGGLATDATHSVPALGKASLTVSLGGKSGLGGSGGDVSVTRNSAIETYGLNSYGILAQSVGGGGGTGHFSGTAEVKSQTLVSIGGDGGSGGYGGKVTVGGTAKIVTHGAMGHGIVAQSVGGGGGTVALSGSAIDIPFVDKVGIPHSFSVGNKSGSIEGHGGLVTIQKQGSITTSGNHAYGLLAQSAGGGGGLLGGADISFAAGSSSPVELLLHRSGAGGAIVISDLATTNSGGAAGLNITTSGIGAHGIFAQSVGGGGGLAILDSDIPVPGITRSNAANLFEHSDAAAGAIAITSSGRIATTGNYANGIFAHSGNFGAMIVATNQGYTDSSGTIPTQESALTAGAVTITKTGSIATAGSNAHGILVLGDSDVKDAIGVTIGRATGGSNTTPDTIITTLSVGSSALKIRNGNPAITPDAKRSALETVNVQVMAGATLDLARNLNAAYAVDIENTRGDTRLDIAGAIRGAASNQLDETRAAIWFATSGAITILPGGSVTGPIVGPQPALQVASSLTIGGELRGGVSGMTSYALSAGGTHFAPVDFLAGRKVVDVGSVTDFSGTLRPYLTRFGTLPVGSGQNYVLLNSAKLFRSDLTNVRNSLVTAYTVGAIGTTTAGMTGIALQTVAVSFASAPIDPKLAGAVQRADRLASQWASGKPVSTADAEINITLLAAANTNDPTVLGNALRPLQLNSQARSTDLPAKASASHLGAMLSCGVTQGNFAAIREGECAWASATGTYLRNFEQRDTTRDAGFVIGRQIAVDANWRVGFGIGYDASISQSIDTRSVGHRLHAGGTLKYTSGPWLAALGVSGSYGWSDDTRKLVLPQGLREADSERRVVSGAARLRLARLFEFGMFNLTPMIDFDAISIHDPGYRERHAGAWDVTARYSHSMLFDIHPSLRLGRDIVAGDGILLRPYVEGGLRYNTTSGQSKVALRESEVLADDITVKHRRERVVGTVGSGLSIFPKDGLEIKLTYSGAFSATTRSHSATVKVGAQF